MLEVSQNEEENFVNEISQITKTEKIDKFVKERVNEFRCEIQKKLEEINEIITEMEIEKNEIIVALNALRTKAESIENSQKQNSIIKRENKFLRLFRILRENAYLWEEIEKEDVIELRNGFGELRGIISKTDIVKAEKEIFEKKKKYNLIRKIKDIFNIKYEKIEANIRANNKEIEKINKEIDANEELLQLKMEEIENINQIRYEVEELLEKYKDNVMEALAKNNVDKSLDLIDIINETKEKLKELYGDVTMLN